VDGEDPVVGFGRHNHALRHEQIVSDEPSGRAADKKEEGDAAEIEQRNALMIGRQQPTA
jgi:hypothetical protein